MVKSSSDFSSNTTIDFYDTNPLLSFRPIRNKQVFLCLVNLCIITVRTIGVHRPHKMC